MATTDNHMVERSANTVVDLGVLNGPVLLFGGAYSNLQALEALIKVSRDGLNIPPYNCIHTGDVVAYCGQPRETCELLRSWGCHCLMGNCEESVGSGKHDCGCGFPEDSNCHAYSVNWYAHVMKELDGRADLKDWMGSLPKRIVFKCKGRKFAVVHGSPRNISEFLWASTPDAELQAGIELLPDDIDGIVSGHSGIPFARFVPRISHSRELLWINAGVIGMPANDGTPRGWYAVLSPYNQEGLKVSIQALHFDARKAADEIYARPALNRGYADALLSGVWPSHDVLPVEEQMETGVSLTEKTLEWPADHGQPVVQSLSVLQMFSSIFVWPTKQPSLQVAMIAAGCGLAVITLLASSWNALRQRPREVQCMSGL